AHGGSQSFSVTPNTGYHIDSVNVDGANQGAVAGYDFTNVTGDHSIAAYFSINKYAVTASASSGGSIFPFGVINVSHGDSASFAITPNTGSHIDSVVVDGVNQGALSFYPFTGIDADHTIDAWFSINTYTVTASASAGGSISPAGAVSVNYGANRSFTVAPEPGYHTDSVVVDGFNQGAVGAYNFLNVTADHAIAAYFSINTYTISASASAGGSISPAGAVIVNHGSSRSFTLAPDTGYHVDSIVVDGVDQGASAAYEFTNVTANHAIAAFFSLDTFTVTAYAGPNGSVAPAGVTTVAYGGSVAYTITPSTGYFIADLRVDSVSVGAVGSYTFTGVTKSHTIEALFSITQFTIGAAASAGGTISPAGLVGVNFGDDTNFTITPDTGYHVDSVLVDGVDAGPVTAYGFTAISADHAISAYFSIDVFTITASASAAGSIAPSGPVSVNYGSDRSFAVTPDTGCHIDSVVVDGVNLGPLAAYDFTGVKSNHAIAAYFSIDLFTVTATAGPNGSIIPPGVSVVPYGGSIGYTIVPDTGYYVVDVHADTVSVGPVASYTLSNVTSNHTIAATFAITSFTVTANASAGGSVSPQGPVSVNYGDSLTIAVTPDAGYHIDSVVVDGVNQGPVAGLDFIDVTANHTVAAFFSIDVFTIAASSTPGGSITPSGSVGVDYGSDGSFTIAPATGYLIDSVVVDGANVGPVTAYDFTNVTSNHSIRAYFSLRTFSVTATAGPNGAVTPSGISVVNYGDSLAFAITPDTGYHVDSVVVDGVNEGVTGAYTFTNITADHTIAAWFSITNFTINATASAGGSISPSGAVGVSYGASRAFTMLPNTGYHVDSVVVDGVNVGAAASYTFPAVTADHAIAAYFSINSYTITASAGAGGGISPSGTLTLVHGSSQAFIITPSTGYAIQDVLVDGVSIGQPASYTFTSLSGNHTIHAVFALRTFTVTALAGPDGSVTPAGTTTVNYGDSLKYTITPDPGSYIEGVAVDGLPVGVVSDYTFTNITSNHQISATFTSNAAPDAVTLVSPADGTVLPPAALSTMRFVWRRSYDADPGDLLKYVLTLTGPGVNFSSFEMTDTSVTLDLGGLAIVNNVTYRWTVRVTDGQVTVASPDSFDLMFDPTTEVGEGPGPLPKAYALGQNYPNPFNPATSIPFDLPERSDVSLTIYNVLGVKVMELAAGESMAAGSYDRKADFSGLPSGVYFYRIAALGESGALFERVMRLVLIR
ncbi:MAG TPA: T9SS type A sorting domain-containing protein, partial [Bacteroidota bacterium]|nr:T9SS type A sorting domain-containing protein [Bacteroidota bacterium]